MPELDEITPVFNAANLGAGDLLLVFSISEDKAGVVSLANFLAGHGIITEEDDAILGVVEVDTLTGNEAEVGDVVATTSLQIGTAGTKIGRVIASSLSVTPGGIAAGASETVVVTMTGVISAMYLSWALTGALPDGMTLQAWISATDQVSFKFHNTTGSTISGATYTARVTALLPG